MGRRASFRREELLGILKQCAEKHGGEASLDDVIFEISRLEPETKTFIRPKTTAEEEYPWKHARLKS